MKILLLFAVLFLFFGCGHKEDGEDVNGHEEETGQEHGHLHVGAFLDWASYGESNTDNGFNQPDSTMTRLGLNVGIRW